MQKFNVENPKKLWVEKNILSQGEITKKDLKGHESAAISNKESRWISTGIKAQHYIRPKMTTTS